MSEFKALQNQWEENGKIPPEETSLDVLTEFHRFAKLVSGVNLNGLAVLTQSNLTDQGRENVIHQMQLANQELHLLSKLVREYILEKREAGNTPSSP